MPVDIDDFILNNHGQRICQDGPARDTWSLGSYSSGKRYWIDVETIEPGSSKPGDDERGVIRLPVKSIARIDGRFFFATDLRFVVWPGSDCVFPDTLPLDLKIWPVGGGWRGALTLDDFPILNCKTRTDKDEVLAFFVAWASMQEPGRFVFPPAILEAIKAAVEVETESRALKPDPGDAAMDDAFNTGGK